MGNRSGLILGLIAIMISAGVGGYVLYDNFIAGPPASSMDFQWHDYSSSTEFMSPGEAWNTSSYLSIEFYVFSGQRVYFSYIGQVVLVGGLGNTYVEITFSVDGIIWYIPSVSVGRYNTNPPGDIYLSVALQHYNNSMLSGYHTVTIAFKGSHTANALYSYQTLFVQTFN